MDMFEEARSLSVMMKMRNISQTETAKMLGVSQSYVANKLRLLKLEDEIQSRILKEGLSERHARALLRIKGVEYRKTVLEKVCLEKLSVAETEAVIDLLVTKEMPYAFGKGERLKAIDYFLDSIKHSLNTIRGLGADARNKISYENNRIYIYICIDENGKI